MISNLTYKGDIIKLTYKGNPTILKRQLIEQTPTYAVKYVTFDREEVPVHPELIANKIGLMVIDQTIVKEYLIDNRAVCGAIIDNERDIDDETYEDGETFVGIRILAEHIRFHDGVSPFKYSESLITVLPNSRSFHITCLIEEGYGNQHVKYSPVVLVGYKQLEDGNDIYDVTIESTGAYSIEDLAAIVQSYSKGDEDIDILEEERPVTVKKKRRAVNI